MVKHREIGRRDVFTKNIKKKTQNDIDFITSILNHTISDAQQQMSDTGEENPIERYERFLTLWKDADPGLHEVEDARKRLAVLR